MFAFWRNRQVVALKYLRTVVVNYFSSLRASLSSATLPPFATHLLK
jgi:hypothetical protein